MLYSLPTHRTMSGISLGQDEPRPLPQTLNADGSGSHPSPTPAQPTFVTSETHIQTTLPSAGGVKEIVYQMTDSISHGRIKAMGRSFHQTFPGDWDGGRMVGFGELYVHTTSTMSTRNEHPFLKHTGFDKAVIPAARQYQMGELLQELCAFVF